jgi:hypothetical protein
MMKALERLTQGLGLMGALVVVACGCLWTRLPDRLGLDVWNVDKLLREIKSQERRRQELDAQGKALFAYLAAKQRLAREVASGRLDLLEAAGRFRHLNESFPGFDWFHFRRGNPGNSDVECLCRQVLAVVAETLEEDGDPGRAAPIMARLEAELQDFQDGERQGRDDRDSQVSKKGVRLTRPAGSIMVEKALTRCRRNGTHGCPSRTTARPHPAAGFFAGRGR